jgi:hypothetical protein
MWKGQGTRAPTSYPFPWALRPLFLGCWGNGHWTRQNLEEEWKPSSHQSASIKKKKKKKKERTKVLLSITMDIRGTILISFHMTKYYCLCINFVFYLNINNLIKKKAFYKRSRPLSLTLVDIRVQTLPIRLFI